MGFGRLDRLSLRCSASRTLRNLFTGLSARGLNRMVIHVVMTESFHVGCLGLSAYGAFRRFLARRRTGCRIAYFDRKLMGFGRLDRLSLRCSASRTLRNLFTGLSARGLNRMVIHVVMTESFHVGCLGLSAYGAFRRFLARRRTGCRIAYFDRKLMGFGRLDRLSLRYSASRTLRNLFTGLSARGFHRMVIHVVMTESF